MKHDSTIAAEACNESHKAHGIFGGSPYDAAFRAARIRREEFEALIIDCAQDAREGSEYRLACDDLLEALREITSTGTKGGSNA